MDIKSINANFESVKASYNIEYEAKVEQLQVVLSVLKGRNVLALLPTGFGKTLCVAIPTMLSEDKDCITIVISPLTSLIDDQICRLNKLNVRCAKITGIGEMERQTVTEITNGKYSIVFSSPESVLKPYWKTVFLSATWQTHLKLIAIDEAHCISEWGDDFRKDYQQLYELRSFFGAPLMALTGTSTKKVKKDIMEHLQLQDEDTDLVYKSPDRPNLYLQILKKESTDYDSCLDWLINHIRTNGKKSKKIIVYCRSIDAVSEIFCCLKDSLGKMAYVDGIVDGNQVLLEMYHKSTHQDSKDRIINEFKTKTSRIRCVIATVALGMGLDISDIDLVVHIGCPKTVLSYWQEAGRCARDGRQGYSLILYDNFTLALKTTDKDIADIVKNKDGKYIRKQILDVFSDEDSNQEIEKESCEGCELDWCQCSMCKCCTLCASKCQCHTRCSFSVQKFLNEIQNVNTTNTD
ncbi:uncharacterized protein LOC134698034 [Mytilus trossulus]|uniref:uncharacterized protein LOC134698034 n=1 Tax=Mytilus trossulus TaxID=6551 RepID=UPI003003E6A1